MNISDNAGKELLDKSRSGSLKEDMRKVSSDRHNPFFRDGKPDADAYCEFVGRFNEFINHMPKRFRPMVERDMKL